MKHNELTLTVQHPYDGHKPMKFTITQVPAEGDEADGPCVWAMKIDGERMRGVAVPQTSPFGLADAMSYLLSYFADFCFNDPNDEFDHNEPLGFAVIDSWGADAMDRLKRPTSDVEMKVERPS